MKYNNINKNSIRQWLYGHKSSIFLLKAMFLMIILLGGSCQKYLNVVPDNIATIANAFASKVEAEKYLYTCYKYMPNEADPTYNPGMIAGDEMWIDFPALRFNDVVWRIARGEQSASSPRGNNMEGTNGGFAGYKAIRDCNVFLDNISDLAKVPDLDLDTRNRWISEVQFLKAYYHFVMFRTYGPIAIIDKNMEVGNDITETRIKRQPVDSVVNYISKLLDLSMANLPASIVNQSSELGRITQTVALSLKARLLVLAASPLFNGNSDYGTFKNNGETKPLINPVYSVEKWTRAALACKAAIDLCEAQGIKLYVFDKLLPRLSDTTMTQMSIRNAVTEKWNSELIWGLTTNNNTNFIQYVASSQFDPANVSKANGNTVIGPTLKIAKMFYSKNGVPINEDNSLDFSNTSALRVVTKAERFNLLEGYTTARLNFDREPRYYADLGFDGSIWYMLNSPSKTDNNTWNLQCRQGQIGSSSAIPITGYFMKKMLNYRFEWSSSTVVNYPWPAIRLADVYLLYAEALNESLAVPSQEVYDYVNKIRARAGLQTVESSWSNYSTNPTKYTTKIGMRAIIHQERNIELCFEGARYWDLLRWKTAGQELNGNVKGWNIRGTTPELYYIETTLFAQKFDVPRDYLFPIATDDILKNQNLVQNPNW
jgi:hypothetical protein